MAMSRTDFKNAFREVVSSEFAHIPSDESSIDFAFSEHFNKRMEKLIRSQKKVYYNFFNTAYKRVAIICVVLLTMLYTACSVKTIREPIVNFFTEVHESYTRYFFEGDTSSQIEKEVFITKLPDGFVQSDKIESDLAITTVYVNNDSTIKFTQQSTSNASHSFDNENGTLTRVNISNLNIDIYESENIKHAVWTDSGCFFKLTCIGDISIDSITMMIKSVQ